jgi:hypothetical protein
VPDGRADLDAADHEHGAPVLRRRRSRPIAVVGDDDELQVRASGRRGNLVDRSAAVGLLAVNVLRASHNRGGRPPGGPVQHRGVRGASEKTEEGEKGDSRERDCRRHAKLAQIQ